MEFMKIEGKKQTLKRAFVLEKEWKNAFYRAICLNEHSPNRENGGLSGRDAPV